MIELREENRKSGVEFGVQKDGGSWVIRKVNGNLTTSFKSGDSETSGGSRVELMSTLTTKDVTMSADTTEIQKAIIEGQTTLRGLDPVSANIGTDGGGIRFDELDFLQAFTKPDAGFKICLGEDGDELLLVDKDKSKAYGIYDISNGNGQIAFPETPVYSTDLNTFDAWKRTSFKPVLLDDTYDEDLGQSYTTQKGFCLRSSNVVCFSLELEMLDLGTLEVTSQAFIGGLPFASLDYSPNMEKSLKFGECTDMALDLISGVPKVPSGRVTDGESRIALSKWTNVGVQGTAQLLISNLTNSVKLSLSGMYIGSES